MDSSRMELAKANRSHNWDVVPRVILNYVEWLALTPEAREPGTLGEFAEVWEVSPKQLLALEGHKLFQDLLAPYRHGTGGISRLAVRLATEELERQATKPGADPQTIKLLLQQAGVLTPVANVRVNAGAGEDASLHEMTIEQLQAQLKGSGASPAELAEATDFDYS